MKWRALEPRGLTRHIPVARPSGALKCVQFRSRQEWRRDAPSMKPRMQNCRTSDLLSQAQGFENSLKRLIKQKGPFRALLLDWRALEDSNL